MFFGETVMNRRDDYYNRAKQEGYRARSAYKLKQIDNEMQIIQSGAVVVDLGAAPGGWIQVADEAVGSDGVVIGVDRQRIDPFETTISDVSTIRGDITEQQTHEQIRERANDRADRSETPGGPVDVVLSDMAPNMTGEYDLDHARSIYLGKQAAEVAKSILTRGGDFVVKVFQGRDLEDFVAELEADFEYVRRYSPDASRDASSEIYLIARNFLTAPVRPGDRRTVRITDRGKDGDGIARIEGYTLFVPNTEVGNEYTIKVTDCKTQFGFAEVVGEETE